MIRRAAWAVALVLATRVWADLPKLVEAPVEAVLAHTRDRVDHAELAALRDELAAGLTSLARERDVKRLAALADRPSVALAIAQHSFLASGVVGLGAVLKEERGVDFGRWLIGDRETLEEFATTGAPPSDMASAISILFRIWSEDQTMESGVLRRLAVAVAIEHATPILPWSEWGDESAKRIDPVARFAFYRDHWKGGTLFPCFETLKTWELRRVVDLPLYDEDIAWFHASMPERLKDGQVLLRSQKEIGNAAHLVPYRDASPTNGKSVQLGKPYYDDKRLTPAIMLEYGGVCGAISKFGSFAARAFGVPAQPIGQEGHCALCWKHEDNDWRTGNGGSEDDWVVSNLHGLWGTWTARGAAIPLMASLHGSSSFMTSQRVLALLALGDTDSQRQLRRELEVTELCPENVYVWRAIAERLAGLDEVRFDDVRLVATRVMSAMHLAPQLALDMLVAIEQTKFFRSYSIQERERYAEALVEAFGHANADEGSFPGGERGGRLAFGEVLGRAVWLVSGKTAGHGDWPYVAHLAILDGTHRGWKEWWTGAAPADRTRVTELLATTAASLSKRPALAEAAAMRLVSLAETNESIRAHAQRAVDGVAISWVKLGKPQDALRICRSMILTGERIAHRPWIRTFTEKALEVRNAKPTRTPPRS
jgi:hypothetical protein